MKTNAFLILSHSICNTDILKYPYFSLKLEVVIYKNTGFFMGSKHVRGINFKSKAFAGWLNELTGY